MPIAELVLAGVSISDLGSLSDMADLTSKQRNKLPSWVFGIPSERKYPMPDKSHAISAKSRATQQVEKGNLSPSTAAKIKAKANRVLDK